MPEIQQTFILDEVPSNIQVIENTEYSVINESSLLQNALEKENIEVLATDEKADKSLSTSEEYVPDDEENSSTSNNNLDESCRNTSSSINIQ